MRVRDHRWRMRRESSATPMRKIHLGNRAAAGLRHSFAVRIAPRYLGNPRFGNPCLGINALGINALGINALGIAVPGFHHRR